MNTAKTLVNEMLQNLPDSTSLEDVQYHLYVLEKIKQSEASIEAEGVKTHQQAKERLSKWLSN